MPSANLSTGLRRIAAASAFAAVLVLGVGTASAQDQHSGGVSPNTQTRDPGSGTEVLGNTVTRGGGGLPVTGSDVAGMVALGAAAVAAGAGAVTVSKRRTRLSA